MTLPARDLRILKEIENELAAAEPRLNLALVQGRLPTRCRRSALVSDDREGRRLTWVVAICGSLLAGIGLLTAALLLHMVTLFYTGVPLTQFGPIAVGYFGKRADRRRRPPINHKVLFALEGEVADVGIGK